MARGLETSPEKLPPYYAISGEAATESEWQARLEAMARRHVALIQLRPQPGLFSEPEAALVRAIRCCHELGRRVLVNAACPRSTALEADGLHMDSASLMAARRRPLRAGKLVGASCHNPEQLNKAASIGVDFVCLSPLRPTASHPDRKALGLDIFADWVRGCPIPVYALGGAGPGMLDAVQAAGAHGVAGISAFWT